MKRCNMKSANNGDTKIAVLLCAFFSFHIVCFIVNTLCNLVVPNTPVDTAICTGIYWLMILAALPTVLRRMNYVDLLFLLGTCLVVSVGALAFPENRLFISAGLSRLLVSSVPLFFLGRAVRDYERTANALIATAYFVITAAFFYYIFLLTSDMKVAEDNMSFAYYLLPHCIFCCYSMLRRFRLWKLPVFLMGVATLFLCGTRGPLVCLAAAMLLCVLVLDTSTYTKLIVAFLAVLAVILLISGALERMIIWLSAAMEELGFGSRVLDKILDKEFSVSEERKNTYALLAQAIRQRPVWGHGIFGDRLLLAEVGGLYAHSLFYELLCDFGIFFGVIVFLLVLLAAALAFRHRNRAYRALLCAAVCSGLMKLFLSGSFLSEPVFYLMLGLALQGKSPRLAAEGQGDPNETISETAVVPPALPKARSLLRRNADRDPQHL